MVGGFAISTRQGEYSHPRHTVPSVAGMVNKALSNLVTSFQDNNKPDPRKSGGNNIHLFISPITKLFNKCDPKEKAQKVITPKLLLHLYTRNNNQFSQHTADLWYGAFFFACRSCKYATTTGTRKTKTITINKVTLFIGHQKLQDRTTFNTADALAITFVAQKNNSCHKTVTQHTNSCNWKNPVRRWASIVNRVIDLPDSTGETTVSNCLGYDADETGCHSLRYGESMVIYLSHHHFRVPMYTIMIQGRWYSNKFLWYMRKQVKVFSHRISEAMISNESFNFSTIPEDTNGNSNEEPRSQNNQRFLTYVFNGNTTGGAYTRHHIFE